MGGTGKSRIAAPLLALAIVLGATVPGVAAPIRIGSFGWEEAEDFLCDPNFEGACVRFVITNELDLLSDEDRLALNLTGTESFSGAFLEESAEVIGPIDAGSSAAPVVRWAPLQATLRFALPDTMTGLLTLPILFGPTFDPLEIIVESSTPTPIPAPAASGLLAVGLGALWARRRSRQRT